MTDKKSGEGSPPKQPPPESPIPKVNAPTQGVVDRLRAQLADLEREIENRKAEFNKLTLAALESLDWSRPIERLVETLATPEEIEKAKEIQGSRRWVYVLRLVILERLEEVTNDK